MNNSDQQNLASELSKKEILEMLKITPQMERRMREAKRKADLKILNGKIK